jgi:chromosome segregation ATPase
VRPFLPGLRLPRSELRRGRIGSRGSHALLVPLLSLTAADAKPRGLPSLTGSAEKSKPVEPAAAETDEQAIARLRRSIEGLGVTREPPDGIPAREASSARDLRTELRFVYERQIRVMEEIARARESRARAEQLESDWNGFAEPPPYSILLVDDLRDTADNARTRIASLEASIGHLRDEQARFQRNAQRSQEAVRLATEAYEAARTETERAIAAWRRDVALAELRKSGAWVSVSELLQRWQNEELAGQRAGLRLVERQVELAQKNSSFTEADVLKARQRYADLAADRRRALADVRATLEQQEKERDEAARNLAQLKASDKVSAEEITVADAWLRAIDSKLAAGRAEAEMMRGQITLAEETERSRATSLGADGGGRGHTARRTRSHDVRGQRSRAVEGLSADPARRRAGRGARCGNALHPRGGSRAAHCRAGARSGDLGAACSRCQRRHAGIARPHGGQGQPLDRRRGR